MMLSRTTQIHSSRSLTKLTEMRRKKLEGIRRREETKHKKERLVQMLTQKLRHKYSSSEKKGLNRQIHAMVKDFVHGVSDVSAVEDGGLAKLEKDISDLSSCDQEAGKTAVSTTAERDTDTCAKIEALNSEGGSKVEGDAATASEAMNFLSNAKVNEWNLLDMYDSVAYESEELKALQERKKEQGLFREHLSKTQKQLEAQRVAEKADTDTFVKEQSRLAQIWQKQQEKSRQKKLERALEERRVREQQILAKQERQAQEEAQRHAEELDEIQRCKEQLEFVRQESVRKRQEEHTRLMGILEENKRENALRAVAKAQEAEEDAKLMEDYKAKLEREDEQRRRAFNKRMERYEAYGRLWADQGAGKKEYEERLRQERLILREAKKKEDADMERERRDKEYLRDTACNIAATNKALAEERRRKLKDDHDADMRYAMVFRQEGEAYMQKEREKVERRQKAEKSHAEFIKKQMEEDRRRRQAVEMSDAERSINRDVLNKVKGDPEMLQRIQEKLNYTPSAPAKVSNVFL